MSVTKECPGCGEWLSAGDAVCPGCGTRWEADGSAVVAPRTLIVPPPASLGAGKEADDPRHYQWVGDLAYLEAAGGPALMGPVMLGFAAQTVAAAADSVLETVRRAREESAQRASSQVESAAEKSAEESSQQDESSREG